ncbi:MULTISPECIES: VENN motif pre-toxin domain-containing protein, partial [unclassified Pseudomonas]
ESKAREELVENGTPNPTREEIENSAIYQSEMARYGTGSDLQRAAQAITAALQGLAGGDMGAALAGASAPYLANLIKRYTDGNTEAQLMAHAVLGALVAQAQGNSAVAGAAGAATAEGLASTIAKQLYGKGSEDLTEAQKQTVVALASLAGGMVGGVLEGGAEGAVAGAKGGQNAVENNEFGGRLYLDRVFEAYVQSGGCGGAARQQCRQDYENKQLANGGLEVAATFALLPVAIAGAASTPAILAVARAAVEACKLNPILCVNETTIAVTEMGIGEALPAGMVGAAGAKLTLEQATKVRVVQEVEQQIGQKLSADAIESILTGGNASKGAGAAEIPATSAIAREGLYNDLRAAQAKDQLIGTTLPGAKAPVTVTAEGSVGGQVLVDTNQTARPTIVADPNKPTLIADLLPPGSPNSTMANAHAEVAVIQRAFDAGVTAGQNMSIVVRGERICSFCRSSTNIMAAAERSGLNSLKLVEAESGRTFTWTRGVDGWKE